MRALVSLIAGLASGETQAALRRARLAALAYSVAGLAALCGVGFLVGAGYIAAARHFGPMEAALGIGIGFLVLSGFVMLVFRLSSGKREAQQARRRKADMKAVGVTAALALLPTLLRGGKGGLGVLLTPAIAAAAYAIYRENTKTDEDSASDKK